MIATLAVSLALVQPSVPVSAAALPSPWSAVVTAPDNSSRRLVPLLPAGKPATYPVVVDPSVRGQEWMGVGAALTDSSATLLYGNPLAQYQLFDATMPKGARLNLLRLPLSSTDFSMGDWEWAWDNVSKTATPPAQALKAVWVTSAIRSRRPDLGVVATAWSAPRSMKAFGAFHGGTLAAFREADYAALLVAQARWLIDHGVPLRAMTVGNEPGHSDPGYASMKLSDDQMAMIANAASEGLKALGVELWALDHNWVHSDRVTRVVAKANKDVFSRAAFHCYDWPEGRPERMRGLGIAPIVTECSGTTDGEAGTFAWDATELVYKSIDAGSTGLFMWNLALDPGHGPKVAGGCENCRGVVTIDAAGNATPEAEFYTLAHLARAAQPKARRLGLAVNDARVPMVAFDNPNGTTGVFGHNGTGAPLVVGIRLYGGQEVTFEIGAGELFTLTGPKGDPVRGQASKGKISSSPDGYRYYIDRTGYRHFIRNDSIFTCHGGTANLIPNVPWADLKTFPETEQAECFTGTPGNIIRHPDGDSYVLITQPDGTRARRWISSAGDYTCLRAEGRTVATVTRYHVAELPPAADRPPRNCLIRAPGGDAHFINNEGRREWVPDSPTWDCEVGRQIKVVDVAAAFVGTVDEVGWHYCLNKANFVNKVARHHDGDSYFIHPDNTKTWIPDSPTWDCRMREGRAVIDTRWREYLDAFPGSEWDYCFDAAIFRNKVVKHADGDSYFVHPDDTKTWIPDGATYACRMNQGTPVVDTRWREYIDRFAGSQWDYCYDINTMKNRIITHPDGDSHYVDARGVRHWIQSQSTYNCLRSRGIPADTVRWREYIDRTPEGEWAVCGDTLSVGQKLDRGQWLQSGDGRYKLHMQTDGNLVVYNAGGTAIWASSRGGTYTVVQGDGNLVEYNGATAVWYTNTVGTGANRLVMQSDGNLVLYSPTRAVWYTGTVGR